MYCMVTAVEILVFFSQLYRRLDLEPGKEMSVAIFVKNLKWNTTSELRKTTAVSGF